MMEGNEAPKDAINEREREILGLLARIRNAHFEFEGQGGEQLLGGEFWDHVDTVLDRFGLLPKLG